MTLPPLVATWLEHIRVLAVDIGPRGSTTAGERKGAEYCLSIFDRLSLDGCLETFTSARSIFEPHLVSGLMFLAAFILYPLAQPYTAGIAALLTLVALVSEILELGFQDNLLRKLITKGPSQNAVAVLAPHGEHRQDLVLIGHVDTQRTPLIFKSKDWVTGYNIFIGVAFAAFSVQLVLYTLGIFTAWAWIWPVSAVAALCAVLLLALCLQADNTPFTAGANDNATAAGLVLTLAEHYQQSPLAHTRLWLVCSGCEETAHYGAIDFFQRHRNELKDPRAIAFEMLGCAGPGWLTKEGIIVPFHASPALVSTAEAVSAEHPEFGAYPVAITGGNTEMADCLRAGVPAITFMGLTKGDNQAPYWHQPADTFDKMNPDVLTRSFGLIDAFIRRLDQTR